MRTPAESESEEARTRGESAILNEKIGKKSTKGAQEPIIENTQARAHNPNANETLGSDMRFVIQKSGLKVELRSYSALSS